MIPPINGAAKNNHSCDKADVPTKIAGPKLLAGLTEVPVIGIPIIWMKANEKPIGIPANPSGANLLVEPKIIKINKAVKITSAIKQEISE